MKKKKIKNSIDEINFIPTMLDYIQLINNSYFIDYDNYSEYINNNDSFNTFLKNYILNISDYINDLLDTYNETLYVQIMRYDFYNFLDGNIFNETLSHFGDEIIKYFNDVYIEINNIITNWDRNINNTVEISKNDIATSLFNSLINCMNEKN